MKKGPTAYKSLKLAVSCINHAFRLNAILNMEMSAEDKACLDEFHFLRAQWIQDLSLPVRNDEIPLYYQTEPMDELDTHELLIAEANTVLALADEQFDEGFKFDAMLNYHTACVFYRVMETMIPSKASSQQHSRLMYAAQRTRLTSSVYQNFVRENFTGGSCSDMYEVHGTSKLGKGSYGSVYLATHRVTGDERAVKVMNVDRITSYYLRKLHTEIAILKTLDHPNIIKLKDVFFGKRSVYIVTDLCKGGELFELLNSGKNQGFVFREDRASKLMKDMFSAVNYLHANNIVHRDLKLENFLFEDHNSSSPLILIDFGLSKHYSPDERLSQKVGSCYYTAPEVLNGNYDFRCDIWSLGVLCYMLLSGSPPFFGKSVEDVYQSILTKEATYTDKKFKHVSNCCMDFMKRLLVREPRHRMTTSEALRHPFLTGAAFFPRYANMTPADMLEEDRSLDVDNKLLVSKSNQVLNSMLVYVNADPLSKIIMEMVSHSLGAVDLQQFREEFQTIDRSNYGFISKRDFLSALSTSELVHNGSVDLTSVFKTISMEARYGRGTHLTYHEYIAAAMHSRVEIHDNRLSLIFTYLDAENKGIVNGTNIRNILGEDIPQRELEMMVQCGDSSGNQQITKSNLIALWRRMWEQHNQGFDHK